MDYLTLCSLLQLLIILITTPVLVLLTAIFTGQASLFQHLDSPAANHQILFDLSSKALGGQMDFKLPLYYTEITPAGVVKCHYPVKIINSGVTKLQAHPVQMCNKWLNFNDM